jgi:TolA-binding protein
MNDDEKRFLEQIQKQNEDAHAETRRQFAALAQRFDETNSSTEQRFDSIDKRFDSIEKRFDETNSSTEQRFDSIEQRFDETSRIMRRHFDTVAEDMRGDIKLLAESLAHVDHKVDINSVKIDRLAADNEVFRAAFANLDRRLRVVEDIVLPQKPS